LQPLIFAHVGAATCRPLKLKFCKTRQPVGMRAAGTSAPTINFNVLTKSRIRTLLGLFAHPAAFSFFHAVAQLGLDTPHFILYQKLHFIL